ncbi:hypothetical protein [Pseudonocardia alaniniphila]|uniref:Uncharacterized protein n=1 Tax=Pseudonocardia alaniniphila TaxID=75291 RepID=A0ABS9TTM2_9PSEU|nr:hypothetical protein [Pseudonocardia alaniniphila]MCH6171918.1 hypothetical protein [Pseudonocardia alaniniphila]
MQVLEYSGDELEDVAGEFFLPAIIRTGPAFRGRAAIQGLGETLTLSRSHSGQMSALGTDRMAARASADNLMIFCIYIGGRCRVRQHDRCAELAGVRGCSPRSVARFEWASSAEARRKSLRFSRELLPLRTAEITEACAPRRPVAPAMQVLAGYLGRLFEVADELTAG